MVTLTTRVTNADAKRRVDCPAGKSVLGGGYNAEMQLNGALLTATHNYPSSETSWTVAFWSGHGFNQEITVYAICASIAN
jgi:hypothetical protein